MTQPIENRTLGGLTYNHNMVKSAKKLEDGNYEIIFKTGEKLTYPEQKDFELGEFKPIRWDAKQATMAKTGEKLPNTVEVSYYDTEVPPSLPRNAKVEVSIEDEMFVDDSRFNITNVMGATFTSSKDARTTVNLNNSSDCTIDLGANDSTFLYQDKATVKDGARNIVKLDDNDSAVINNKRVESKGTAAQKDY